MTKYFNDQSKKGDYIRDSLRELCGWTGEDGEWFPFATMSGGTLYVNPDNDAQSYWEPTPTTIDNR